MSARKKSDRQKVDTLNTVEGMPPPMPPKTAEEQAKKALIIRMMRELADDLQQANLNRAVRLAQMAARGQGPLVEHFAELGRRYADLADFGPPKPQLRVIEGGEP